MVSVVKIKKLFPGGHAGGVVFSGIFSVAVKTLGRTGMYLHLRAAQNMDSADMGMLCKIGSREKQQDFPFGYAMYDEKIQRAVPAVCLRTEAEAAAFVLQIHAGDEVYFGKMIASVAVEPDIGIKGMKGKQQFHCGIGIGQLAKMQRVEDRFHPRVRDFVAYLGVIADAAADGKMRDTLLRAKFPQVQFFRRLSGQYFFQDFYGIGGEMHSAGKIIAGTYGKVSEGNPAVFRKPVQDFIDSAVAADDDQCAACGKRRDAARDLRAVSGIFCEICLIRQSVLG